MTKQPHAIVIPYPAQGHINPFMQLAKQLVLHGFTVTFVNSDHNHARIVKSQSSLYAQIGFEHIPDGLPDDYDRMADLGVLSKAIDDNMPRPFEALVRRLVNSDNPPVCVFSDLLMLFTQGVANMFGLPRVAVWLQSAASFVVCLHAPRLFSEGYIPITDSSKKELIRDIPGHPPLSPLDLPSFFQKTDASKYMVEFKLRPFQFQHLQEPSCILINTFHDLEPDVLTALQKDYKVLAAGPFLPPALLELQGSEDNRTGSGLWPEDTECLPWLDRQNESSVLYISFGSIATLSQEQFKQLVLGLEATNCPILWAIRPDVKDMITSFLSPNLLNGDRVYITTWAPQALVLSHKNVGGFLTHCGWNSTLESISMGVPSLNWPHFADQMMNRKWLVEEWKIGKSFKPTDDGLITKEEVARLIKLLMEEVEGKEMQKRAKVLSKLAKKSMQKSGSSCANLQSVLQTFL